LLFVLWEYLPVLTDIINSYLSSVTNYQISIKLKESSEKLELETKILDEKWERDVKSLSWWQRTLLKLVWMLAISSYMKTEMLFLDETVNNLDIDTVWKVAQMIDDFVKQREMKFYTITHNSEIQSMKIWNATLEIWKEN
jgi:DNA repair exonuclease SbcCD ATPase subunit